ncbi:MAG: OmpA family protein [Propionibacteriaceae bacterium]|jgi:hypothetical protein|nr:OmpA family protein [Propionibacteriaceae bacterium]
MSAGHSRRTTRSRTNNRHIKGQGSNHALPIVAGLGAIVIGAGIIIPVIHDDPPEVAAVVVHNAPDRQTSAIVIPTEMATALAGIANNHDSILKVRVEGDGTVNTATQDLTPRTAGGEVSNVQTVIDKFIEDAIAGLETEMNTPSSATNSRSLYRGLLATAFPANADVWIMSPGIDLAAPDNALDLGWEVPVGDVVASVSNAKAAVPDLKGANVTFVMTAPAGDQQMRASTREYLHDLWRGLLLNGNARSVTFIDMPSGKSNSDQDVQVVPMPPLPTTPIVPEPDPVVPEVYSCTLQTSAGFVPDTADLLDEAAVRASLEECVAKMAQGSHVHLDGWVAYFGDLGADGKPSTEGDVGLSQRRCDRIAKLLQDMGVPGSSITTKGHGAVDQPYSQDPTSQQNRVVVITVTPPEKVN